VFFISLEDDLAKRFGGERMQRVYELFKIEEDQELQSKMLSRSIENAQRTIEGRNFGIRKHVLEYDDVMNKQREVMYAERMKVIKDENVHEDILKLIPDFVRYIVSTTVNNENKPDTWDLDALNSIIELKLLPKESNFATKERTENWDYEYFVEKLTEETKTAFETDERVVKIRKEIDPYAKKVIAYATIEYSLALLLSSFIALFVIPLIAKEGRTLGKFLLKVAVRNKDDSDIKWHKLLLRTNVNYC
jgi:preprotein translocase subunit SecA